MVLQRPSDCWNGFESLKSLSGQWYEQIRHVLDSADFQHLEHLALAARRHVDVHLDEAVNCSIDPSVFSYGLNSVVFEVAFSDNVYWVAKVHVQHDVVDNSDVVYMLSEIATMKSVKERTTIPVPRVFGHQTSSSEAFQFPFMLMEFLPGRDVGGPLARDVPAGYLPKVAKQLADVLSQLESQLSFEAMGILWCGIDCTGPPEIISLPSEEDDHPLDHISSSTTRNSPQTSLEWFYERRQEENRQVMEQHSDDPEWNTACWVLKDAISHTIIEDRVHGPFPLCHMDFHHGNLLFDEEYNLTGVIDWSNAQTAPLERLALSPEFVAGPLCSKERRESCAKFLALTRASLRDFNLETTRGESPGGSHREDVTSDGQCGAEEDADSEDDADSLSAQRTTLADIFGNVQAEIANGCTLGNPRVALWFGRMVQKLVYGEHVSWEQMVLALGKKSLH